MLSPLNSLPALVIALSLFTACHGAGSHTLHDDLTYIPLSEYKYEQADIKTGTGIRILAYSGGKDSKGKDVYYCQFIGIDQSTHDTVRVLTSLISTDSVTGSSAEIFTIPSQFDGQKGVFDAVYEAPADNQNLMLRLVASLPEDGPATKQLNAAINDSTGKKEYVAVNKGADIFERKYKTTIGVLRFHDQPW
jgi:hypothetical protein